MKKLIGSAFERIGKLVQDAGIPENERSMAMGCLKKLPGLCASFCESYESRDVEEILRLERGMLARLAEPSHPSPDGRELAKLLNIRLSKLHERLGLPEVNASKSGTAKRQAR